MQITVSRTLYVADIVPPRCRRPRGGSVVFPVPCTVPEYDPATLRAVAKTLTHPLDAAQTTTIFHHPETGFLTRLAAPPEQLPAILGDTPRPDALPVKDIPNQILYEIATTMRETRAKAIQFAVIGHTLFEQTQEPVYMVQYHPSVNYDSVSLTIRSAPAFTDAAYGTADRNDGALPRLAHLFNARHHTDAEALLRAIAATGASRAREDRITVGETDQITLLVPDIFTFEATRWHAAREAAHARHRLATLLDDLAQPFPNEAISALLYPERLALAAAFRATLASDALIGLLKQADGSNTGADSAQPSLVATRGAA